jgi:hypothetical protein
MLNLERREHLTACGSGTLFILTYYVEIKSDVGCKYISNPLETNRVYGFSIKQFSFILDANELIYDFIVVYYQLPAIILIF